MTPDRRFLSELTCSEHDKFNIAITLKRELLYFFCVMNIGIVESPLTLERYRGISHFYVGRYIVVVDY